MQHRIWRPLNTIGLLFIGAKVSAVLLYAILAPYSTASDRRAQGCRTVAESSVFWYSTKRIVGLALGL